MSGKRGTGGRGIDLCATLCYICNRITVRLGRDFERFEGQPIIAGQEVLHVTLDKRGMLNMNAFCHRELGKPTAVYLHFSRKEETIAVEPVHSFKGPNAFPFRPNGSGRYIKPPPSPVTLAPG